MQKYQRFFPVEDREGKLLPQFIAIRNGGTEHLESVREGNERVLAARFADAAHFYQKDLQTPLETMAGQLGRLIFQEKLGTMADKRRRLEILSVWMAQQIGSSNIPLPLIMRSASLCKADLVSQMVMELPALQGIMGREYALAAHEDPRVADAIAEHYMPRYAGDSLPGTLMGKLLGVADRMDTLVGYVSLGIVPSGSSDPYGLRRAAHGATQILAGEPDMPTIMEIQAQVVRAYHQVNGLDLGTESLRDDLRTLFDQRITALLEECGVRYDLIDAALYGGLDQNRHVYAIFRRAETLQALAEDTLFVPTVQAGARVANILHSEEAAKVGPLIKTTHDLAEMTPRSIPWWMSRLEAFVKNIDTSMLQEESEHILYNTAYRIMPEVAHQTAKHDYKALYHTLDALREPVNCFFDNVLVMVDDMALRRNRLILLQFVDSLYKTLADFTKVRD
jgi:glycyl-tRNA synthetase beta chain